MIKQNKLELSLIYLVAMLLVVSLAGLGRNVVAAMEPTDEPYPNLYAAVHEEAVPVTQKTVYFTFDDGPSLNTVKILDMLKEQDIKATFFVCAQQSDDVNIPEVLRRIVDEGHTLGLHTYCHKYQKVYKSVDDYLEDLDSINSYIMENTGYHPDILRFPGGSGTRNCAPKLMQSIIKEVTRRGYVYYDWNVVSGDETGKLYSKETLAKNIMNGAKGKEQVVVLLHDSPAPKTSCAAVELAIGQLREQGYAFDKLTVQVPPLQLRKLKTEE